jgi:DNA transposition AAA+ family ATPase
VTNDRERAFVETHHYRRFREFCNACRRYRYIGVCYGLPGVGKTLSARHYANWDTVERYRPGSEGGAVTLDDVSGSAVVFYTPPPIVLSLGKVPNEVEGLRRMLRGFVVEKLRQAEQPRAQEVRRRLDDLYAPIREGRNCFDEEPDEVVRIKEAYITFEQALSERQRAIPDPTELILIDEADRLKVTALEQMRSIFDRGGIGMVLIGMPGIEKKLARYPQLYSRVGFVHEYAKLSQAEVRQLLADGWWPEDAPVREQCPLGEDSIAAIVRVTGGNFRLLHRLLTQIGRLVEINSLDAVTPPVVETARESLVIGAA